jgi:hypothetical protein
VMAAELRLGQRRDEERWNTYVWGARDWRFLGSYSAA